MYDYGEACPVSKATSILCERWTLQIVREMLLGATRFSALQRMLPRISPTLLNSRLRLLTDAGIVMRKRIPEQRGFEYHLTPAGKALEPVITELGRWGMHWIFDGLEDDELDAVVLLGYMAALLKVEELPSCDTVLQFTFDDFAESPQRFIFIHDGKREVCDVNPGHEVDVFIRGTLRDLSEVFWGERDLQQAIKDGVIKIVGPSVYTRSVARWFPISALVGERRGRRAGQVRSRGVRERTSC
jgi:DNA-binding HxlR family transcriptional regulator